LSKNAVYNETCGIKSRYF